MIDNVWAVLCSKTIIEQETNNISLITVIEHITVPKAQEGVSIAVPLELATLWERRDPDLPASGHARISLELPGGKAPVVAQGEFPVDLSSYRRLRGLFLIHDLPVPAAGTYYFRVELREENEDNWRQVARVPLEISEGPVQQTAE